ncbi:DUF1772-domain-containing protein [Aspergillus steynii IBT 23096]|uniref:DUF1772-domain-containing protein n=1 Tax=Aspergillus steynii IBT 23096 TaxID=1392250 RepID=A0A2I2GP96_9EURO|nr:DUF1772-domain-containing protein [Aspergillus steynii IBT 23096]PLB54699.1 DUF1772-domain-containing protein [Aspergillus steynii IBT 23096]
MSSYPPGVRVAQVVGLTGSAWLAGNITALSVNVIPALLKSHHQDGTPLLTTLRHYRNLYDNGHAQNPPIAALTASAFGYLAYAVHNGTSVSALSTRESALLYVASAVLTIGIVPWTIVAMTGTNRKLLGRAEAGVTIEKGDEREVLEGLERWAVLNAVRGVFPLLGGVVGVVAGMGWPVLA